MTTTTTTNDLILQEVRIAKKTTVPELANLMYQKHCLSLEDSNIRHHLFRLENQGKIRSEVAELPPALHQQGSPKRRFYYSVD
jgi:hypothetical protein